MTEDIQTQLYLRFANVVASEDASLLAPILALPGVASVRISPAWTGEAGAIEAMRVACHERDLPLIIEGDYAAAIETCRAAMADGVHLADAPGIVERARTALGDDLIIGVETGSERHAAMSAAEAGADYVSITPVWEEANTAPELVIFWSEVVETPIVVENAPALEGIRALRGVADFVVVEGGEALEDLTRLAEAVGGLE